MPQEGGHGHHAGQARERLATVLEHLHGEGLLVAGMIGDPDPYTAAMNALQFFRVSDVIVSDAARREVGLAARDLLERIADAARIPVDHVVVDLDGAERVAGRDGSRRRSRPRARTHHEAHPPEAHRSSRVEPQLLGMLLFIISEVMVFGAFFTAYFFIRVVNADPWPAAGTELPIAVAGVNTAILLSSSLTMHWALDVGQARQPLRAQGRDAVDLPARRDLPVRADQRVRPHRLRARTTARRGRSSTGSPACTARTCSSACTLLAMVTVRSFRGHFSPEQHRGVEVPGIYWHFVDVMWVIVYTTVYLL